MADSYEDSASCLICLHSLLSSPVCALKCGHVYHGSCLQDWLRVGKGDCPTCKAISHSHELRMLDFTLVEVESRSVTEVRELQGASAEERAVMREKLLREEEDAAASMKAVKDEVAKNQHAVRDCKRARKELEQQRPETEKQLEELRAVVVRASERSAELQARTDAMVARQQRKLPTPKCREDDADLNDERRKLRGLRQDARAKQVHEALCSARRQEAESGDLWRERESALQKMDEDRRELRRQETRLSKELAARDADDLSDVCGRSNATSSATCASTVTLEPGLLRRTQSAATASPAPPTSSTTQEEEMDLVLYGGSRRGATTRSVGATGLFGGAATQPRPPAGGGAQGSFLRTGVGSAATAGSGGGTSKWGGLFSQKPTPGARGVAAAPTTTIVTPAMKKAGNTMMSLFSNQVGVGPKF